MKLFADQTEWILSLMNYAATGEEGQAIGSGSREIYSLDGNCHLKQLNMRCTGTPSREILEEFIGWVTSKGGRPWKNVEWAPPESYTNLTAGLFISYNG